MIHSLVRLRLLHCLCGLIRMQGDLVLWLNVSAVLITLIGMARYGELARATHRLIARVHLLFIEVMQPQSLRLVVSVKVVPGDNYLAIRQIIWVVLAATMSIYQYSSLIFFI